jgi:hypothetical protein
VLSIGKVGAGQAKYYLDQAQGRVDVVDSVGEGIEEYYIGGAEARGEWIGTAAAELGLRGPVEERRGAACWPGWIRWTRRRCARRRVRRGPGALI